MLLLQQGCISSNTYSLLFMAVWHIPCHVNWSFCHIISYHMIKSGMLTKSIPCCLLDMGYCVSYIVKLQAGFPQLDISQQTLQLKSELKNWSNFLNSPAQTSQDRSEWLDGGVPSCQIYVKHIIRGRCLPKAAFVLSDQITLAAECWTNCKQSKSN